MKRAISLLFTVVVFVLPGLACAQVIISQNPPIESQPAPPLLSFENNPELSRFDSWILRIPFVDSEGIPGLYQDATIEYLPLNKAWRLSGYTRAVPVQHIQAVEVTVTDEIPAQVFLEITGTLNNGCLELGQVGMKRVSTVFTVYLFYQPFPPDCIGTADVRQFRKVVPLAVYGLNAGTYAYDVNGTFSGTFTLVTNNVF